ncbi:morphogenetic protein [Atlantibacter hermannii]|uniref:morphogenetic protein n=1 Tax=Atlantibacter hermannii TaxID=565 RepID=UPI0028A8D66C|nr:morphogenetic protein [Atlantibacter hermannii]
MKERGMIFNDYQVRALLDGSMTQVRRPVKFPFADKDMGCDLSGNELAGEVNGGDYRNSQWRPGVRIYVREYFSRLDSFNFFDPAVPYEVPDFWYWADGEPEWGDWTRPQSGAVMPREASRITLEVTGVRVERLQSADESDLLDNLGDMLEHCDSVAGRAFNHAEHYAIAGVPVGMCPEMHGFKAWWDKVNGAGSFESNPWVWVIEFKRVEGDA